MLKCEGVGVGVGGHGKIWGSFNTGTCSFSNTEVKGGGAKKYPPFKKKKGGGGGSAKRFTLS